MPSVRVSGWEPGLRKISLTKLLQMSADKDLQEAKAMVDALIEGKGFEIYFDNEGVAKTFADHVRGLGAQVTIESP
jgi:hypothetical protein